MRHQLLVLAAVLIGAANARAESVQCTPIDAVPATISAPGSYCLTGDLVSGAINPAAAITLASDDVTLDFNGHAISGPGGANAGLGVYAIGRRNLRVRNGTLRGFSRSVLITDTLVGFPPIQPSGASNRHEVSGMRVEGGVIGIAVLGFLSSVHDNLVQDCTQWGISASSDLTAGKPGGNEVRGNRVINTSAPAGSTTAVYGIAASSLGGLVQDNFVGGVHGPGTSAGIFASGTGTIVSRNRETDLGTGWGVYCASAAYVPKVEGNLSSIYNVNHGISGCAPVADTNN
jgi:hypothetical protein